MSSFLFAHVYFLCCCRRNYRCADIDLRNTGAPSARALSRESFSSLSSSSSLPRTCAKAQSGTDRILKDPRLSPKLIQVFCYCFAGRMGLSVYPVRTTPELCDVRHEVHQLDAVSSLSKFILAHGQSDARGGVLLSFSSWQFSRIIGGSFRPAPAHARQVIESPYFCSKARVLRQRFGQRRDGIIYFSVFLSSLF